VGVYNTPPMSCRVNEAARPVWVPVIIKIKLAQCGILTQHPPAAGPLFFSFRHIILSHRRTFIERSGNQIQGSGWVVARAVSMCERARVNVHEHV